MRRQGCVVNVLRRDHVVKLGDLPEVGAFEDVVPGHVVVHVALDHPVHVPGYLQPQSLLGAALPHRKLHPSVEGAGQRAPLVVRPRRHDDAAVEVEQDGLPRRWVLADAQEDVPDSVQVQGHAVGIHAGKHGVPQPAIVGDHPHRGLPGYGEVVETVRSVPGSVCRATWAVGVLGARVELDALRVRVAVDEMAAEDRDAEGGVVRPAAQPGDDRPVRGHPDADPLHPLLVRQVDGVPSPNLGEVQYCSVRLLGSIIAAPYLGLHGPPGIRQAGVVASEPQDGLPERLQVYSVLLVPVLAHDQLEAAHQVSLDAPSGTVRVLVGVRREELDVLLGHSAAYLEGQHPFLGDIPAGGAVLVREPDGVAGGGKSCLGMVRLDVHHRDIAAGEVRPEAPVGRRPQPGERGEDGLEDLPIGDLVEAVEPHHRSLAALYDEALAERCRSLVQGGTERRQLVIGRMVEVLVGKVGGAIDLELALCLHSGAGPWVLGGPKDAVNKVGLQDLRGQRVVKGELLHTGHVLGERRNILLAVEVPVGKLCARLEVEGILTRAVHHHRGVDVAGVRADGWSLEGQTGIGVPDLTGGDGLPRAPGSIHVLLVEATGGPVPPGVRLLRVSLRGGDGMVAGPSLAVVATLALI